MNYTITESQKRKIIDALRFAADTANARAAGDWSRLADYLEVLDPGKIPAQSPEEATSR
ncbi:MAG: hypothetical protein AAFN42_04040 [Cyanobacteria bacterium J06554_1]